MSFVHFLLLCLDNVISANEVGYKSVKGLTSHEVWLLDEVSLSSKIAWECWPWWISMEIWISMDIDWISSVHINWISQVLIGYPQYPLDTQISGS